MMSKLLQRSFAPTRGVAWSDRIASKRGLRVIWGSATEPATRLSEKRRLPVPTALLLDTVLDVNRYHEFLPFCAGSRVMTAPARSGTHGSGFDAELVIGFKAFNSAYTSRVSWHQEGPVWRVVAKSIDSRLFDTMDSYWELTPVEGGRATDVEFAIAFELNSGSILMKPVVNAVLEDVAKEQIGAFERRCSKLAASADEAVLAQKYASAFSARLRPPGLSPVASGRAGNRGALAPGSEQLSHRNEPWSSGLSPTGTPLTGRILDR